MAHRAVVAFRAGVSFLFPTPLGRHDLTQEPGAIMPLTGISAGAARKGSLYRDASREWLQKRVCKCARFVVVQ